MVSVFCDDEVLQEKIAGILDSYDLDTDVIVYRGGSNITPNTSGDQEQIEVGYHTLLDLAHELVHVKQILEGRLSDELIKEHYGVPYSELPWEIEAYEQEEKVLCMLRM